MVVYLLVLIGVEVNNDLSLVVDTHVPEVRDCLLEWQLCRDERRFALETLTTSTPQTTTINAFIRRDSCLHHE